MIPADELEAMTSEVERTFDTSGVIHRRTTGAVDDFNNPSITYIADADPVDLLLVHTASREVTVDRNTQISDWFARLPAGTSISGRDRLVANGATYEVLGPPSDEDTHVRVQLVHVSGG